jgi:hypothetical protein
MGRDQIAYLLESGNVNGKSAFCVYDTQDCMAGPENKRALHGHLYAIRGVPGFKGYENQIVLAVSRWRTVPTSTTQRPASTRLETRLPR